MGYGFLFEILKKYSKPSPKWLKKLKRFDICVFAFQVSFKIIHRFLYSQKIF